MKSLMALTVLITLFSCVKKEEEATPQNVTVSGAGSTNFGKVRIGEHRVAGVQIKNPTTESLNYSITGIIPPFSIDGTQGDCSLVAVNPGGTCLVKIRFTPVVPSESFMTIQVLGQDVAFQGKGLMPGTLSLGLNSWNAGVFKAGEQETLNVPISNIGDTDLGIPRVANPGFQIIAQNCGTEVAAGESCQLVVAVQKAIAQDYTETLQFYTLDSATFYDMDFIASVTPGDPSGSIEFQPGLTQIVADNSSLMTVTTMPVRDVFGNVVADGETVVATPLNINIVGSTSATTVNGIVSFNLRATGTTGVSRLILSSNLASGVYNVTSVSGPPVGAITLKAYNADVRANNLATLTVETNPLLNISGNVVTDGTPIEVILVGPGTIISNELYTVNGVLRVQIKSTLLTGVGSITMRANPTYDGNGDINGYDSYGQFPINFIPLDTIGNFDVISDHPSIYFLKNLSGRVDETTVSIVDIRDENDNPVGAGFTADIKISNGVHSITNFNSFSTTTDALSAVTFPVKGIGLRDWITIDVTINGTSKSHRIFAVGEQEVRHNKGITNKITLTEQRADSRFDVNTMTPGSIGWKNVEVDYYGVRSLDNTNFGFKKSFGHWTEIAGPFRHLIWDCIIPIQSYVGTAPCEEKKQSGTAFEYRSYSIHEIKTERQPETFINANIPTLPSSNSAFGEHILGPISAYDKILNKFHIFGGVAPNEIPVFTGGVWVNRYSFDEVTTGITYGDVSLMAYSPFAFAAYDDDLAYPVAPSYYRYKEEIYIFGGLKKELPGIEAGAVVQHFTQGDLFDVVVGPGADGSPVGRYQNGVYYEEDTSELFVFGGRNANGVFLDEIWKTNMSVPVKTWVKICNLCGLPDNTINNTTAIISMLATPVTMAVWQATFEPMRPPLIIKDNISKKTFYTMPYNAVLSEIDFATGTVIEESLEEEFQEFRSYGHLVQHQTMDRFYRHDIVQAGTTNTKLYYKDGHKGQMVYYKAEVSVNEEARLYAQDIIPVVSAYSANSTTRLSTTVSDFGVEVYLFDFVLNRWVLVGDNTLNSPGLLTSNAYSIKPVVINPTKYFSPDNKVHILIRPKQDIGYQINPTPESGASNLLINLIQLNGVF